MMNAWVLCALWVGLALIATLIAIWFRTFLAGGGPDSTFFLPRHLLPKNPGVAAEPEAV